MNKKHYVLTLLLAFVFAASYAQPKNWFNLDLEKDSTFGVSTERAYELLKGRESKTVIVAVIDGGTDYKHEDLKDVIWVNPKEIPGNGIDDDKNGYIDDIHGWNFIGGSDGDVGDDTYEVTRLYGKYSRLYEGANIDTLTKEEKKEYAYYTKEVKPAFLEKYYEAANNYFRITAISKAIDEIVAAMEGKEVNAENLKKYQPKNSDEEFALLNMIRFMGFGMTIDDIKDQFSSIIDHYKKNVDVSFNTSFNPRKIVGDNYDDASERFYGNNDYKGPDAGHGTHVAGIIAASRNNNIGIDGVADNVKIMIIRVVPDGDERDKDVANGIRYAVDNGATVINMSFGKAFKYNKEAVDEAVKYAQSKDVLLVHAAGNDSKNTDVENNFPTDAFEKGGNAKNWLEIGACGWTNDQNLTAEFSNYGKKNVDVFAPGVQIESTTPDDKYAAFNGTSMASPVTAGVCALIRSYFPTLTAEQVKDIIMKSATPVTVKVYRPGTETEVKMKDLCVTGGVVNAYKAVELAMKTKGKKK